MKMKLRKKITSYPAGCNEKIRIRIDMLERAFFKIFLIISKFKSSLSVVLELIKKFKTIFVQYAEVIEYQSKIYSTQI